MSADDTREALTQQIFAFLHNEGNDGIWKSFDATNARIVAGALGAHLAAHVDAVVAEQYAEIERLREFIRRFQATQIGARESLKAQRDEALTALASVTALADEWEVEGIPCSCGHDIGGDHNSGGCYGVIMYSPLVRCECALTDDQLQSDVAATRLRAVLAPVSGAVEGRSAHIDRSDPANPVISIDRAGASGAVTKPDDEREVEALSDIVFDLSSVGGVVGVRESEAIAEAIHAAGWRRYPVAKHEQEVRADERAWAERFLEEWARPYFGDDASDAVAAVMRAAAAARIARTTTEGDQ